MSTVETAHQTQPAASGSVTLEEQRFLIYGVSWKEYVVLREALDIPGLRMFFDQGVLELMSPSAEHERIKKIIARLLELYALERDVPLQGYGSATFRKESRERGAEPDECYVLGGKLIEFPDLVLEVVMQHGGVKKLPIYQSFGVREVWFWQDNGFHLYRLGPSGYEPASQSELVPGLDFEALTRFVRKTEDQHQTVKEFRDWLRSAAE